MCSDPFSSSRGQSADPFSSSKAPVPDSFSSFGSPPPMVYGSAYHPHMAYGSASPPSPFSNLGSSNSSQIVSEPHTPTRSSKVQKSRLPGSASPMPQIESSLSRKRKSSKPSNISDSFESDFSAESVLVSDNCPPSHAENFSLSVLDSVVKFQRAGGYWEESSYFFSLLSPEFDFSISRLVEPFTFAQSDLKRIECTILAISVLRQKETQNRDVWKLMEAKGLQFLNKMNPQVDWDRIISSIQFQ